MKVPSLAGAVGLLAERARTEGWTHDEFLAACLQREVAVREAHGGEGRIRAARFPARTSLEDFGYDDQRSLKRETISNLGRRGLHHPKDNVVFLGPPGAAGPLSWVRDPAGERQGRAVVDAPALADPAGSRPHDWIPG
ncbi:ATP-binding protein [Pseudonocardia sp. KRD291]|uniref:ATP-binding protein n=1 Tax=Pseudonocardia sp. KRD291 TaxID=2792007 RepID=UPI001C4A56D1|nr:ATP-binding protein [Pseudonocardia sp. KRD291]